MSVNRKEVSGIEPWDASTLRAGNKEIERERERESKRTGYRVQDVRDLLGEQVCSDFGVSNSVGY